MRLEITDGGVQYQIAANEDTALEGWSIGNYLWTRGEASTGEFDWGGRPHYNSAGTLIGSTTDPEMAVLLEVHGSPIGGV